MLRRKYIIYAISFFVLCIVLIVKYQFYDLYQVPQNGMYPSIVSSKGFLCKKYPYKTVNDVKRGDIVVFKAEWENGKQYDFIWRVIGLPGDLIEMQDDQIVVNGSELKKEKIQEEGEYVIYTETNGEAMYSVAYTKDPDAKESTAKTYEVPQNHVFVLGDNRDNAADSRKLGMISFESIFAKKL